MLKLLALLSLITLFDSSIAQIIDVKSYSFNISINDTSDLISVREVISIDFIEESNFFELDLSNLNKDNKGMVVHSVERDRMKINFTHSNDKLKIKTDKNEKGSNYEFLIKYSGIPEDGLVIGKNKFNNRTLFGDNWPTRARNWLAVVDHPSDKALVKFNVIAPAHYKCISNGKILHVTKIDKEYNSSSYASKHELPTKVMVFGLADFIVDTVSSENLFPITSWVYEKDKKNGFSDLKVAVDPLNFFISQIGKYPFEKLANVQSTTRYGGMENAGCIFYDENAIKGDNSMENLIAHEIAHQWFGNSVTESDWEHLWLSEGFATYMTNAHLENKYGVAKMNDQFASDRKRIIAFKNRVSLPVIDTITTDLMQLLNPNSYQKGAWTLHMLRNKIGDKNFWKGIQQYYSTYKYKNASSSDFIEIMEQISGQELNFFFNQWLKRSDIPIISRTEEKHKQFKTVKIELIEVNKSFAFPLEIAISNNEELRSQVLYFDFENTFFEIEMANNEKLILDPNTKLLFEEIKNSSKKKNK